MAGVTRRSGPIEAVNIFLAHHSPITLRPRKFKPVLLEITITVLITYFLYKILAEEQSTPQLAKKYEKPFVIVEENVFMLFVSDVIHFLIPAVDRFYRAVAIFINYRTFFENSFPQERKTILFIFSRQDNIYRMVASFLDCGSVEEWMKTLFCDLLLCFVYVLATVGMVSSTYPGSDDGNTPIILYQLRHFFLCSLLFSPLILFLSNTLWQIVFFYKLSDFEFPYEN